MTSCLLTAWQGETFQVLIDCCQRTRYEHSLITRESIKLKRLIIWNTLAESHPSLHFLTGRSSRWRLLMMRSTRRTRPSPSSWESPFCWRSGRNTVGVFVCLCVCVCGCSQEREQGQGKSDRQNLYLTATRASGILSLLNRVRPALIVWNFQSKLRLSWGTFHFELGCGLERI